MQTQKIFLASSSELKEDRKEFEIFINRKNKEWVDKGVFLKLIVWEDFLDALSPTRLQDEYNKEIRQCDLFVMLFFTKVGKYTAEEFETAFGQFQAARKPFIFTYFKDAEISTGSAVEDDLMSLFAFKKKLKALGHFQTVYQNLDALKFHFSQQLDKLVASGSIEFKPEKGSTLATASPQASGAADRRAELDQRSNKPMPSDDRPITVFYSYAHADEKLRDELAKHLSLLKNQGYIQEWHDRDIEAGQEWEGRIDQHLAAAQFILLLISPDFMASPYCYSIELKRAMERHAAGEARVVPIILKPVDWQSAPFGQLQALPKNAKAVTTWPNRDEAFLDIAQGIRRAVERLRGGSSASPPRPTAPTPTAIPTPTTAGPLRHDQTATVTGGGAYIRGNVNTGGGKFVGRDDHSTVAPPTTATPAQLPALLQELRIALAAVPLDADERAALQDDLAVVEAQWAKPEPKRALLRAKLASLQSLIEAAAGGMEATAEPLRLLHHLARISRQ